MLKRDSGAGFAIRYVAAPRIGRVTGAVSGGGHGVAQLARHVERDALFRGRHGLDRHLIARAEGVDHLVDEDIRSRGAGGDADPADIPDLEPIDLRGALDQEGTGQPDRWATSTRRSELELLGAPTTIRQSICGAIAFTADCRLVVA